MIQIETSFNTEVLDRLSIALETTPQIIQDTVTVDVQPVVTAYVENTLVKYPPPIQPGVFRRHATPKQLRYVMAKIRRGEWTGRTGALAKAWQTLLLNITGGVTIIVRNTASVARYIVGDQQQGFHAETGWPQARSKTVEFRRVVYLSLSESLIRRFVEKVRKS